MKYIYFFKYLLYILKHENNSRNTNKINRLLFLKKKYLLYKIK